MPTKTLKIRIYVAAKIEMHQIINLNKNQTHYCQKVMRLKHNATICIFNEKSGEWQATLNNNTKDIFIIPVKKIKGAEEPTQIHLYMSLIKGDGIKNIIRQSTELGVSSITPLITQRTNLSTINHSRLINIATEAAEQCGRITIPIIHQLIKVEKILVQAKHKIIFCNENQNTTNQPLSIDKTEPIGVIIGPEGGFSAEEVSMLVNADNIISIGIGPLILKADTAAISIISCLNYIRERWSQAPQ